MPKACSRPCQKFQRRRLHSIPPTSTGKDQYAWLHNHTRMKFLLIPRINLATLKPWVRYEEALGYSRTLPTWDPRAPRIVTWTTMHSKGVQDLGAQHSYTNMPAIRRMHADRASALDWCRFIGRQAKKMTNGLRSISTKSQTSLNNRQRATHPKRDW